MTPRFILASASASRRDILRAARIRHEAIASHVDEEAIKEEMLGAGASPAALARELAAQKARDVGRAHPDALILGADQLLACEGKVFSKAASLDEARATLKYFRGRKHELIGALALVLDGRIVWEHLEISELWVRDFSDEFLDDYLATEGEEILGSVGCYRIEAMGAQIFEKLAGDQFAIRGLALFPLLDALRERGIAPA
jgi:septum formation protein